jgi:hypothetical protein
VPAPAPITGLLSAIVARSRSRTVVRFNSVLP